MDSNKNIDEVNELRKNIETLWTHPDTHARRLAALRLGRVSAEFREQSFQALYEALKERDEEIVHAVIISLGRLGDSRTLNEIIVPRFMESEDISLRYAVIDALNRMGGMEVIEPLSIMIKDPVWDVRNKALISLGDQINRLSHEVLMEKHKILIYLFTQNDPELDEKVISAFASLGSESVFFLVESLAMKSPAIRKGTLRILGKLMVGATITAIIPLLHDPSFEVRKTAVETLGDFGDSEIIEHLVEKLGDTNEDVSSAAIKVLSKMGNQAVKTLNESLKITQKKIYKLNIIRTMGIIAHESFMVPLLNHLSNSFFVVRQAAVNAIVSYGMKAVPDLIDMTKISPVPVELINEEITTQRVKRLKLRAIRSLGELKNPLGIPVLRDLLKENDPEIQIQAQESLSLIGLASWGRVCAIMALGMIKTSESLDCLIRSLYDPSNDVRPEAVRALQKLGEKRAVPDLIRVLEHDPDESVRGEAAQALGILGIDDKNAVAALCRALNDSSRFVRSLVIKALGRIADPDAIEPLIQRLNDSYWSVRSDAENALNNIGKDAVEPLIRRLDSEEMVARLRSARILGYIGDERALKPLKRLIKREKESWVIQIAADSVKSILSGIQGNK